MQRQLIVGLAVAIGISVVQGCDENDHRNDCKPPEPKDRFVISQSLVASLVLVPLSLIPAIIGESGPVYLAGAICLGSIFLYYNVRFAFRRSNVAARQLLAASIIYLPLDFILMMLDKR